MKKQILFIALAVMGLTACEPGGNTEVTTDKEAALMQKVAVKAVKAQAKR